MHFKKNMKKLDIKLMKVRQIHITKRLVHSFSVYIGITFGLHSNLEVTSASRVD